MFHELGRNVGFREKIQKIILRFEKWVKMSEKSDIFRHHRYDESRSCEPSQIRVKYPWSFEILMIDY